MVLQIIFICEIRCFIFLTKPIFNAKCFHIFPILYLLGVGIEKMGFLSLSNKFKLTFEEKRHIFKLHYAYE